MLGQAISKIQNEMDKNKGDQYIQVIGNMLLKQLEINPKIADKIIAGEKTIAKSIDAMAQEAKKKQRNGRAMLTDAEGFAIVLKYYGIDVCMGVDLGTGPDYSVTNGQVIPNQNFSRQAPKLDTSKPAAFKLDLDDLLA